MLGSLGHVTRQLIVPYQPSQAQQRLHRSSRVTRSSLRSPTRATCVKPVVLVEDNGPIHTSKRSLAARAARAHWLTVEWLPKYTPELNAIEVVWHDLKAFHLAHQTFTDTTAPRPGRSIRRLPISTASACAIRWPNREFPLRFRIRGLYRGRHEHMSSSNLTLVRFAA